MIDEEIRHIVEAELQPGEELLWAEKPRQMSFHWDGVTNIFTSGIFVLIFGGFLSLTLISIDFGNGVGEIIFDLVAAMIVVALFAGSIWLLIKSLQDFLSPFSERYALTTHRAIIICLWPKRYAESLDGSRLTKLRFVGREDIGTIEFPKPKFKFRWGLFPERPLFKFRNIQNPKKVEDLIRETHFPEGTPL